MVARECSWLSPPAFRPQARDLDSLLCAIGCVPTLRPQARAGAVMYLCTCKGPVEAGSPLEACKLSRSPGQKKHAKPRPNMHSWLSLACSPHSTENLLFLWFCIFIKRCGETSYKNNTTTRK